MAEGEASDEVKALMCEIAKKACSSLATPQGPGCPESSVFEFYDVPLLDLENQVNSLSPEGHSLLICTIWNQKQENRDKLLKQLLLFPKCNINQVNNEKNSPLHIACLVEDVETVTALVKDKRLNTLNAKNIDGETPLMMAVKQHKTMSVEVMLEAEGVDLLTRNKSGKHS